MSQHRKGAALLAVAAGAVLAVAVAATTARSGTKASAAPKAACKSSKGKITYGIAGAGITQLDPNTISFAGQEPLQSLLYNGLTKYSQTGKTVPDLATSWRSTKDLKTWTFKLRKGVRYSNGRLFTSADARANFLRVLDPNVASQAQVNIADVVSVRAYGKYSLTIRLAHPSALLPTAIIDVKMSDTNDIANVRKSGTGTGPYKVQSFTPGQSLVLVPNTRWFGGKACLKQIVFVREPDPTAMVTDFKGGKLDMIWQVRPADVPAVRASSGVYFLKPKGVAGAHVWEVDTTSPPFNDVRARRALSYAINRPAMVKTAFFGLATASKANDLIATNSSYYDKKLKAYGFSLAKAKKLFTQAGVKKGTTFTFWALAGRRDEWITMAQILQQDLKKIGLNLDIRRNDVSTWLSKFYPAGKKYPDTIIANYFSLPPNPTYALSQAQYGSCECNWKNNTFESLAQKAVGLKSAPARQKLYDRMQALLSQQAPIMVIAHQTNIVAAKKRITNAWEDAQGNVHLEGARVSG
jgi:peptide/nickel transport system substrate-binding protein